MIYKIYGIKNCDTMKKAFKWLDEHKIEYQFYNYKTDGLSEPLLDDLLQLTDWRSLLNTKGMTWRKLDESERQKIDNQVEAKKVMLANPSIIKRPILVKNQHVLVGFSPENYEKFIQENP